LNGTSSLGSIGAVVGGAFGVTGTLLKARLGRRGVGDHGDIDFRRVAERRIRAVAQNSGHLPVGITTVMVGAASADG
jgi:hypothetical protein